MCLANRLSCLLFVYLKHGMHAAHGSVQYGSSIQKAPRRVLLTRLHALQRSMET